MTRAILSRKCFLLAVMCVLIATAGATAESPSRSSSKKSRPAPSPADLMATMLEEEKVLAADAPPPVPKGFTTVNQIKLAVATGIVKLIDHKAPIPIPDGVRFITSVTYGKVGRRHLLLDLYVPKGLTKPVPGLIFIHGGGWSGGDKKDYRYYAVRYASRGYVVASISYRLVKEAPYPAAIQDAKCAVRWLRANAEKYHIDPNKLAAIGGSAGGHLAMMLGYSAKVSALEGDGGNPDVSSAVQAVVNLYGPVDLTVPEARKHPTIVGFFGGRSYAKARKHYKRASPITHVDKKDPPTLILHGTLDDLVPIEQADKLAKRLEKLGVPCTYDRLEGYPHTMDIAKLVNIRCQWFISRFLAEQFGKPRGLPTATP